MFFFGPLLCFALILACC